MEVNDRDHSRQPVLSDVDVREIRILRAIYGSQLPIRTITEWYGICRSSVSLILRGKSYLHAGGPIEAGRKSPDRSRPGKRSKAYREEKERAKCDNESS